MHMAFPAFPAFPAMHTSQVCQLHMLVITAWSCHALTPVFCSSRRELDAVRTFVPSYARPMRLFWICALNEKPWPLE